MDSSECRHQSSRMQSQGGDLRKGGASDARYAIVVDEPEARGEAAAVAIAVASDVFREYEEDDSDSCSLPLDRSKRHSKNPML